MIRTKHQKNINPIVCFAVAVILILAGCTPAVKKPVKENTMQRIGYFSYPDFSDDMVYEGLEHSIQKSLSYLQKLPPDRKFIFGRDQYNTVHMIQSLELFLAFIQGKPSRTDLEEFIKSNYIVYQSIGRDGRGQVLYTGYYEPHLKGSLNPSEENPYPIYARPEDLVTIDLAQFSEKFKGERIIARISEKSVIPYYDRKEIESEGALAGKAEAIAWVNDPVDIFFLQIQGSGKVYLDNGEVISVHYHTTNGRPYRSIGKLLIDEKKITREEMSMQKIREYLREHPEEIEPVLNHNPSYVFFTIEPDGPLGNINVKLTPGRSIALDRRIFPPAALAFISAQKPVIDSSGEIHDWSAFTRFALNQDTGGAIRGPGRADLFWGNGPYAEIAAGHLKHEGRLFFLILKPE